MTGADLIARERRRQVRDEGFTAEHDDENWYSGELALAAATYALGKDIECEVPSLWPLLSASYKPGSNRVRELVKAGALIAAEIDRLRRNL
jgi:hypothetical protein